MEVVEIKELEAGGALMTVDLTKDEIDFLIEYAINDILRKKLDSMEMQCKD